MQKSDGMIFSLGKHSVDFKWEHLGVLFVWGLIFTIPEIPILVSRNAEAQALFLWSMVFVTPFAVRFIAEKLGYDFKDADLVSIVVISAGMGLCGAFLYLVIGTAIGNIAPDGSPVVNIAGVFFRTENLQLFTRTILDMPLKIFLMFATLYLAFNFDWKNVLPLAKKAAFAVLIAMIVSELLAVLMPGITPDYFAVTGSGMYFSAFNAVYFIGSFLKYAFYLAAILFFIKSRLSLDLLLKAGAVIYAGITLQFIAGLLGWGMAVTYIILGAFLVLFGQEKKNKG